MRAVAHRRKAYQGLFSPGMLFDAFLKFRVARQVVWARDGLWPHLRLRRFLHGLGIRPAHVLGNSILQIQYGFIAVNVIIGLVGVARCGQHHGVHYGLLIGQTVNQARSTVPTCRLLRRL